MILHKFKLFNYAQINTQLDFVELWSLYHIRSEKELWTYTLIAINIKEEIMDFENNQDGVSLPHFLQRGKSKVVSFWTVWTVLEVGTFK